MAHVLFIDGRSDRPYDGQTADREALGGTEATVARVATGLRRTGVQVTLAQQGRRQSSVDADGVRCEPLDHHHLERLAQRPEAVVFVRCEKLLPRARRTWPAARLATWLHCFPGTRRWRVGRLALETDAVVVAVSDTLAEFIRERVADRDPAAERALDVRTVYNPVARGLTPDPHQRIDPDKLVFASSPHKGLEHVVAAFDAVRRRFPSMQLYVSNPGYLREHAAEASLCDTRGIVSLGRLPHREAVDAVRDALCLFYPQHVFPETFGLVFAEANAVGTPVLAHPLGAAEEVLADARQLIDGTDHRAVVERITRWRSGERPVVTADPRFSLRSIVQQWRDLLLAGPRERPKRYLRREPGAAAAHAG